MTMIDWFDVLEISLIDMTTKSSTINVYVQMDCVDEHTMDVKHVDIMTHILSKPHIHIPTTPSSHCVTVIHIFSCTYVYVWK